MDKSDLFYGGAFYRTGASPTRNAAELPVAFLFEPSLLTAVSRYYPFDTGALATGKLGPCGDRLKPYLRAFEVSGTNAMAPTRVVHHVFGSNENYLYGQISPECRSKPSPLPELYELATQDLTGGGTDHRQTCIECHSASPIDLGSHLAWMAFPESCWVEFQGLCRTKMAPRIPQYYQYKSHAIFNPSDIAYDIHQHALEYMKPYVRGL